MIKLNLQNLVHIFANILLKIHYSFPMKYWLLLCLFLPPFHFSFMIKYWLLSCLFLQRFLFWFTRTTINLSFFFLWREEGSVWGESAPSEAKKKKKKKCNFQTQFAWVHVAIPTRRNFDKFLVRHGVSPTTQISYTYVYRVRQSQNEFTCASAKMRMLQSETENNYYRTRVVSY